MINLYTDNMYDMIVKIAFMKIYQGKRMASLTNAYDSGPTS